MSEGGSKVGIFDKRISFKDVVFLLGLVFALGQTWTRFEALTATVESIQAGEEHMATREEVEVLDSRLRRWIDRVEEEHMTMDEETVALRDALWEIRLLLAEERR